jgi:FAD binding domain
MSTQNPNPAQGSILDPATLQDFRSRLRGAVLESGHSEYEDARRIQNGLIDRRPGLIIRSSGTADVVEAVNFARDRALLLSIRGGGHNVAGNAMNDGGVVIDLSAMRGAAEKLRSAPIFAWSSNGPSGNAAVAKNHATVKPIAAANPTTLKSRQDTPAGRCSPNATPSAVNKRIPIGFPTRSDANTIQVPALVCETGTPALTWNVPHHRGRSQRVR